MTTPEPRRLRRNDVVFVRSFYGRVSRRLDDEHVEVICCGRHITRYRDDEVEYTPDYKGFFETRWPPRDRFPVWRRMPSLRRLKQLAAYYNNHAWARHRGDIDIHADGYFEAQFAGGRRDAQEARWRRDYPAEAAKHDAWAAGVTKSESAAPDDAAVDSR